MESLSQRTGMPAEQLCEIMVGICLVWVLFGTFQTILSNLVGVVYPAFKSFQALESDSQGDDRQWLTYWIIFAVFTFFDHMAGKLCLKRIVPFYFFLKIGFLVFLFHPRTEGALLIYKHIIAPFLRGH